MDALYKNCTDGISPDEDGVHIISIDGTSFKRYLELAKILGIKVAAIRDNDSDFQTNCVANYENYTTESINILQTLITIARHSKSVCIKTIERSAKHYSPRAERS